MFKYPKTFHLPFSPGLQNDDRLIENYDGLKGKVVVISEKNDGENTSIYSDHIHARSLDSQNHLSRNWVRAFAAQFQHAIPIDWRICGENMYAMHSIFYKSLPSYFLGFSVWDDKNYCLEYWKTQDIFQKLGITPVRELWMGKFEDFLEEVDNGKNVQSFLDKVKDGDQEMEGFVLRVRESFHYDDFKTHMAKYVRKNHISTDAHWMNKEIVKNGLREG